MSNESLVAAIKNIVALAKAGNIDESYETYRALFASPEFHGYRPDDQRQALKLMVMARHVPAHPTPAVVEAHRSAIAPLTALVAAHGEASDHELLGICHVMCGDESKASEVFRAGLAIERQRDPQSDLCGSLMKRVSLL